MNNSLQLGAITIVDNVVLNYIRKSSGDIIFTLREIDDKIIRGPKTKNDKFVNGDFEIPPGSSEANSRVSVRHACTCLNIELHPAGTAEIAAFKSCNALGCRAPCASVLTGASALKLFEAFGRPEQAAALRRELEAIEDPSLSGKTYTPAPDVKTEDSRKKRADSTRKAKLDSDPNKIKRVRKQPKTWDGEEYVSLPDSDSPVPMRTRRQTLHPNVSNSQETSTISPAQHKALISNVENSNGIHSSQNYPSSIVSQSQSTNFPQSLPTMRGNEDSNLLLSSYNASQLYNTRLPDRNTQYFQQNQPSNLNTNINTSTNLNNFNNPNLNNNNINTGIGNIDVKNIGNIGTNLPFSTNNPGTQNNWYDQFPKTQILQPQSQLPSMQPSQRLSYLQYPFQTSLNRSTGNPPVSNQLSLPTFGRSLSQSSNLRPFNSSLVNTAEIDDNANNNANRYNFNPLNININTNSTSLNNLAHQSLPLTSPLNMTSTFTSPQNLTINPVDTSIQGSSIKPEVNPVNCSPPMNGLNCTTAPCSTPMNASSIPMNVTSTPMNTGSIPMNASSTPTNMNGNMNINSTPMTNTPGVTHHTTANTNDPSYPTVAGSLVNSELVVTGENNTDPNFSTNNSMPTSNLPSSNTINTVNNSLNPPNNDSTIYNPEYAFNPERSAQSVSCNPSSNFITNNIVRSRSVAITEASYNNDLPPATHKIATNVVDSFDISRDDTKEDEIEIVSRVSKVNSDRTSYTYHYLSTPIEVDRTSNHLFRNKVSDFGFSDLHSSSLKNSTLDFPYMTPFSNYDPPFYSNNPGINLAGDYRMTDPDTPTGPGGLTSPIFLRNNTMLDNSRLYRQSVFNDSMPTFSPASSLHASQWDLSPSMVQPLTLPHTIISSVHSKTLTNSSSGGKIPIVDKIDNNLLLDDVKASLPLSIPTNYSASKDSSGLKAASMEMPSKLLPLINQITSPTNPYNLDKLLFVGPTQSLMALKFLITQPDSNAETSTEYDSTHKVNESPLKIEEDKEAPVKPVKSEIPVASCSCCNLSLHLPFTEVAQLLLSLNNACLTHHNNPAESPLDNPYLIKCLSDLELFSSNCTDCPLSLLFPHLNIPTGCHTQCASLIALALTSALNTHPLKPSNLSPGRQSPVSALSTTSTSTPSSLLSSSYVRPIKKPYTTNKPVKPTKPIHFTTQKLPPVFDIRMPNSTPLASDEGNYCHITGAMVSIPPSFLPKK